MSFPPEDWRIEGDSVRLVNTFTGDRLWVPDGTTLDTLTQLAEDYRR